MLKRIKSLPKGVKASIAFFISSLVTKGIAYITTPVYTRLLTSAEFGKVSIFFTWLQVFGIIAMFSFMNGVFNNGMVDFETKRDEFSFSLLILSNIITVCFSIILFAVYPFVNKYIGIDVPLLILMCVIFLFQPAYSFWMARQRYEYKYKASVLVSILSTVISSVVAVLIIVLFKDNRVYSRIFGAEVVLLIMYIAFYFYLAKNNSFKISTKYWWYALSFNLPLIPHYLSSYMLGCSDRIMISYLIGDSQAGYYSVAYSVASIATIVWTAINGSLIPYTYEKCKVKDYNSIGSTTQPVLLVFAVACVISILLAPEVVGVMATKEYMEAIYVIPPIVGGVFFQVQYYIYANVVYYFKKPKYVMISSVTATILNLFLNYYFISKYGYLAAGYTTLFCYLVQAILDFFAMKKVVGCNVYNMKFISLLSIGVIAIALFSNLIYDNPIIRYMLLLLIFIGTFLFRSSIIKVVKKLKSKGN